MAKADTETHENEATQHDDWLINKTQNEQRYKQWIDAGYGGDDKPDNYGYYQGRLVKIDYPD